MGVQLFPAVPTVGAATVGVYDQPLGQYDVNTFARKYFNGGGHINAAGGRFDGSMKDAEIFFLKVLPEFC